MRPRPLNTPVSTTIRMIKKSNANNKIVAIGSWIIEEDYAAVAEISDPL